MIEKRTITFKQEQIIEALEIYYNQHKDEDKPKVKFYKNTLLMNAGIPSIELEVDESEADD